MKVFEFRKLIREEIAKVLSEESGINDVKVVTNRAEIDRLLKNKKISRNCTYVVSGSYNNIIALVYNGDEYQRMAFLEDYVKKFPNHERFEYVEYVDGHENTFTL